MSFTSKCLVFGGTDEYVTMGNVLAFERTQSFSFSFWFKSSSVAGGWLFTKMDATAAVRGYGVWLSTTGFLQIILRNDQAGGNKIDVQTVTTGYNNNAWHHVVVTYAGTSLASGVVVYVDGASVSLTINTNALSATIVTAVAFVLAARSDVTSLYVGSMDEVAIYGKALSGAEVAWVFNNGRPRDLLGVGSPTQLLAWWRCGEGDTFNRVMDYGLGATHPGVGDLSGNGYNGTMTNMRAVDSAAAYPGRPATASAKAITFDGTNEYVTMGNVLAYERTDSFSVSFWFKTTATDGPYILGKMGGATAYRGYGANWTTSGQLGFILRNDNATSNRVYVNTVSTGWNDGKWHHVVWTYAGTSLASGVVGYVDGASQTLNIVTDALSATIVDTSPFLVGGASTAGVGWVLVGSLDEVAVYSKALSSVEAAWIYNDGTPRLLTDSGCPSNLAAWWRCGDGDTYPTLTDSGGSGYSGTMTNMVAGDLVYDSPYLGGAMQSMSFQGEDEYIDCGNNTAFDRLTPFSISLWVRWITTTGCIIAKAGAVSNGWFLEVGASGELQMYLNNTYPTNCARSYTTVGGLNDGNWHHIVMTYDGSSTAAGILFYIDGASRARTVGTDTLTSSILSAGSVTLAFRASGYPNFFAGSIDEVALYSRVLTAPEVAWIHNSGTPRSLKDSFAPSGLVGWWRLGESSMPGTMTNMEAGDITSGSPDTGNEAYTLSVPTLLPASTGGGLGRDSTAIEMGGGTTTTLYYKMRAQDSGAAPPGYVTWVATGEPDFTGIGYPGAAPTPVGPMTPNSAVVASEWEETV